MGWATPYIESLQQGETVSFRPRGNSMKGKIASGQLCTVRSAQYLHLVKAVRGSQYQIGNNIGGINGWISRNAVFGKLVSVE